MTTREAHARPAAGQPVRRRFGDRYVIAADRVFDGTRVLEDHAVAVRGDRIAAVAPADRLPRPGQVIRFAGTLLPGFIDLHGHPLLGQVPPEKILRHGITTIRDTGGPLVAPSGGDGRLRVLAAGPILTAPGGYPIPIFGPGAGLEVADVQTARRAVGQLVTGGAALIKIALEPGGSPGAPWSGHQPGSPPPWPVPSLEVVRAIVEEAHAHGRIVAAHLSGPEGAQLALDAGVDEWAHVPCDPVAGAVDGDDFAVVQEPVQDRGGQDFVAEDGAPFNRGWDMFGLGDLCCCLPLSGLSRFRDL